jgi:replication-associated recombination protein RarA
MLELAEGMQEELIDTRRRSYLDQSPRSVLELVRDDRLPHLVILGSPGSGKSTLLKALALEWAQELTRPSAPRTQCRFSSSCANTTGGIARTARASCAFCTRRSLPAG